MDFFVSQPPSIRRKKKYHRYQANQKPSSTHPLAKCSSRSFILSSLYIILYTTILKVPNKKMVYARLLLIQYSLSYKYVFTCFFFYFFTLATKGRRTGTFAWQNDSFRFFVCTFLLQTNTQWHFETFLANNSVWTKNFRGKSPRTIRLQWNRIFEELLGN
jgi:hypothetical protein